MQKSNDDDHQARVRYNASVITANETPKGVNFNEIKRVIIIFITRFDIFHGGFPIYHVDRIIRELNQTEKNGFEEIYVNANAKKHDNILNGNVSDLMDLFIDRDSYDFEKFPAFSKRKNTFVNTEKGENEMCEKVEQEFKIRELNNLFGYVQRGSMTLTSAAKEANLSTKEFKYKMLQNGFSLPVRRRKTAYTSK